MSVPVRPGDLKLDAIEVLCVRAEAKAELWSAGEIDLHDALDDLWAAAVNAGLVEEFGTDEVQALLTEIFAPYRDGHEHKILPAREAAAKCFAAEMRASEVYREPTRVPEATLKAAKFLHDLGDFERFKAWFDRHSADERAAISRHLNERAMRRRGNDRADA